MITKVGASDFPSENGLFRREKDELPAEGLEPTRSCDHWILSPARLPFRHAGVSKGSERIRSSRPSSNASDQIERLQTARWPENFAQNNRVPQTGCRSYQRSDVDSYFRRLSDTLGSKRVSFCRRFNHWKRFERRLALLNFEGGRLGNFRRKSFRLSRGRNLTW